MRATKSTLIPKLVERDSTNRTSSLIKPGQVFRRLIDLQLVSPCVRDGLRLRRLRAFGLHQITFRVILAKVDLLMLLARQLGNMKRRWFFTLLALHVSYRRAGV